MSARDPLLGALKTFLRHRDTVKMVRELLLTDTSEAAIPSEINTSILAVARFRTPGYSTTRAFVRVEKRDGHICPLPIEFSSDSPFASQVDRRSKELLGEYVSEGPLHVGVADVLVANGKPEIVFGAFTTLEETIDHEMWLQLHREPDWSTVNGVYLRPAQQYRGTFHRLSLINTQLNYTAKLNATLGWTRLAELTPTAPALA